MHTRLLLISHAATAAMRSGRFPADDPADAFDPTDKRGMAAAAAASQLRERLSAIGNASILCSPAACAGDTARMLGFAAEMQIAPELADADYGHWRGRRLADIAAAGEQSALTAWSSDPDAAPPGGESFRAVLARTGAWLDSLEDAGAIIAITHAPLMRAAIIHALNAPPASFPHIEITPLSVVELRRSARGWTWWAASS
jgi:broad specificity phosphatase PhoE